MNPVCRKCGDTMEFDDHVSTNMDGFDNARGYMCSNTDCEGSYLYVPYAEWEVDAEIIRCAYRMGGEVDAKIQRILSDDGTYIGTNVSIMAKAFNRQGHAKEVNIYQTFSGGYSTLEPFVSVDKRDAFVKAEDEAKAYWVLDRYSIKDVML